MEKDINSGIQPHSNNQATVTGTLAKTFAMDHEIFGEKFYSSILETPRLSGTVDRIRIMVSEVLMGEGMSMQSSLEHA